MLPFIPSAGGGPAAVARLCDALLFSAPGRG
jgi:hypothetical protein